MASVTLSAPDSHRKLQELEGFEGLDRSQLLATALKTFYIRDPDRNQEYPRGPNQPWAGLEKGQRTLEEWVPTTQAGKRKTDPQPHKVRLTGLGLHTSELPGAPSHRKNRGSILWFLVDTGAAHSVLPQPESPH